MIICVHAGCRACVCVHASDRSHPRIRPGMSMSLCIKYTHKIYFEHRELPGYCSYLMGMCHHDIPVEKKTEVSNLLILLPFSNLLEFTQPLAFLPVFLTYDWGLGARAGLPCCIRWFLLSTTACTT